MQRKDQRKCKKNLIVNIDIIICVVGFLDSFFFYLFAFSKFSLMTMKYFNNKNYWKAKKKTKKAKFIW